MNTKARLKKLEKESSRYKKDVSHVGIIYKDGFVDPKSEENYQAYLKSGSKVPFIWIRFRRPHPPAST